MGHTSFMDQSSPEAEQRQLQRQVIDAYIAAAEAEDGLLDPTAMWEKAERVRAYHVAHRSSAALAGRAETEPASGTSAA